MHGRSKDNLLSRKLHRDKITEYLDELNEDHVISVEEEFDLMEALWEEEYQEEYQVESLAWEEEDYFDWGDDPEYPENFDGYIPRDDYLLDEPLPSNRTRDTAEWPLS
jgi:hypothetical protein